MLKPWIKSPMLRSAMIAALIVAPAAILSTARGDWLEKAGSRVPLPQMVDLRPGSFRYRLSGEFTRGARPVMAPQMTIRIEPPLAIMKHQVTAAAYLRCVQAGSCVAPDNDDTAPDHPVVGVSWRDAQAYATWLSRETGERFRLPTDEEWAFAAAGRVRDDALPESAYDGDPGRRLLAKYDWGTSREDSGDRVPQPIGSFGMNENELLDVAGNVWEWTDTCFERSVVDESGGTKRATLNCGVRIAAGRHRAYVPDFIRDANAGGCSAGKPPSNLGIRLVRDAGPGRWLQSFLDWYERLADLSA